MIKNKLFFLFKYNNYNYAKILLVLLISFIPFLGLNILNTFFGTKFSLDNEIFFLLCGLGATATNIIFVFIYLPNLFAEKIKVNVIDNNKIVKDFILIIIILLSIVLLPAIFSMFIFYYKYDFVTINYLLIAFCAMFFVLNLCFLQLLVNVYSTSLNFSIQKPFVYEIIYISISALFTRFAMNNILFILLYQALSLLVFALFYLEFNSKFQKFYNSIFNDKEFIKIEELLVTEPINNNAILENISINFNNAIHILTFKYSDEFLNFCKLGYIKKHNVFYNQDTISLSKNSVLTPNNIKDYQKCLLKEYLAFMYSRNSPSNETITINLLLREFIKMNTKLILLPLSNMDNINIIQLKEIVKECEESEITLVIGDSNHSLKDEINYNYLWKEHGNYDVL